MKWQHTTQSCCCWNTSYENKNLQPGLYKECNKSYIIWLSRKICSIHKLLLLFSLSSKLIICRKSWSYVIIIYINNLNKENIYSTELGTFFVFPANPEGTNKLLQLKHHGIVLIKRNISNRFVTQLPTVSPWNYNLMHSENKILVGFTMNNVTVTQPHALYFTYNYIRCIKMYLTIFFSKKNKVHCINKSTHAVPMLVYQWP